MDEYQVRYPVKIEYKKHKTSGKGYTAFPTYNAEGKKKRKFVYFPGLYKSDESLEAFDAFYRDVMGCQTAVSNDKASHIYHYTVGEITNQWRKDQMGGSMQGWANIVAGLLINYSKLPANEFTTRHYKQCVDKIANRAATTGCWNKNSVRRIAQMITDVFRFGVEDSMCEETLLSAIKTVRTGKIINKYGDKIREETQKHIPEDDDIAEVINTANPVMKAMIIVGMETGMRPAELAHLNKDEINDNWIYTPKNHKNAHRGQTRAIPLNKRCREALDALELIRPDKLNRYYFTVREALAFRKQARRKDVFTPALVKVLRSHLSQALAARAAGVSHTAINRWRRELEENDFSVNRFFNEITVKGSNLFVKNKFHKHLREACDKAGVERFCPYAFRHKVAQEIRDNYGVEAASAMLGHKQINTTELYAKNAEKLALDISKLREDRSVQ